MRCTPYLRSLKAHLSAQLTKTSPLKALRATLCCWETLPGESGEFKLAAFWWKTRKALLPPFLFGAAKRRHEATNFQHTSQPCEKKSVLLFLARVLIPSGSSHHRPLPR